MMKDCVNGTIDSVRLKESLKQIQLRAQVQRGRTLTHGELADMAGVTTRSLGDWMRGITSPAGMSAILELLSQLDEGDVMAVLRDWRAKADRNGSKRGGAGVKQGLVNAQIKTSNRKNSSNRGQRRN